MPTYYRGTRIGAINCGPFGCTVGGACNGAFDGINSRLFAAKAAVTNVLNGSGDIDWGLMRYSGTNCAPSANPFARHACVNNGQCASNSCIGGFCKCTTDFDCPGTDICNNPTGAALVGTCGQNSNLCNQTTATSNTNYWETDAA